MINYKKKSITKIIIYAVLIIGCFLMLLPFLWMISTSLKECTKIYEVPPKWIPKNPQWSNYKRIMTEFKFYKYMLNSAMLSAINIIGNLLSCSLVAFAFANQKFKYKKQLFILILSTMMLPGEVVFFPQFILFNYIGWYGTLKPLWVPSFLGNAFFIFLMRQYFLTIPSELVDAAKIDGCSSFKIFCKIYFFVGFTYIFTSIYMTM